PRNLTRDSELDVSPTPNSFAWMPDGKKLVLVHNSGTLQKVCLVPVQGGAPIEHLAFDATRIPVHEQVSLSDDGKTWAMLSEAPATPREIGLVRDSDGLVWSPLKNVNPQLTEVALGDVEALRWKSKDDLEIEGLLVKPVGYQKGKRYPLLTYVHGGPA